MRSGVRAPLAPPKSFDQRLPKSRNACPVKLSLYEFLGREGLGFFLSCESIKQRLMRLSGHWKLRHRQLGVADLMCGGALPYRTAPTSPAAAPPVAGLREGWLVVLTHRLAAEPRRIGAAHFGRAEPHHKSDGIAEKRSSNKTA
jgi:hypothetical protein